MKFIVSSSNLLKELQSVAGVLNSNNTLPILDYFLFKVTKGELEVSASDLETTMTTKITLEKSDSNGSTAVPARLLIDTLKTFADQPLSFDINDQTHGIEISSDNGKYKLAGLNGEEFPKTPAIEGAATIKIDSGVLHNAIIKTLFASGNDELRPAMSGVFFELGKEGSNFVATDAHKLVRYHRKDVVASKPASFVMPKKPLNLLKNLTASINADIELNYNGTNAQFSVDGVTLFCRLIDGKYPNYEAVIPKENPNKLTIGRQPFLNSIRRISIFSNKTTHQVRLKIAGSELNISAEDLDFSNEANERLTCNYEGEDMEIGFNSRFIIEMLNNLDTDQVVLEMSLPNRAGLLLPAENASENETLLMLVMPVMLNS